MSRKGNEQKPNNSNDLVLTDEIDDPSYRDLLPTEEEIFHEEVGYTNLHEIESLSHHSSTYTPTQKLQAVTYYVILGSLAEVHRRLGINYNTLRRWKSFAPWWGEAMERIRKQRNDKLDSRLSNQMEMVLVELEDRISDGDEVVLRDGSRTRKKMAGKELAVTYGILHQNRALLRGDATSNPGGGKTQGEILSQLKDAFEELSEKVERKEKERLVSEQ